MIYLIESVSYNKETKEITDLLKIGFTENRDERYKAYLLHNPEFKLLYEIEGSKSDELALHDYFQNFRYCHEWYRFEEDIIEYFEKRKVERYNPQPQARSDGRIYWDDLGEVVPWLCGKYGIKDVYLRVLFRFPDATVFNPYSSIDSNLYSPYLDLLETMFRVLDNRYARGINCAWDYRYKLESLERFLSTTEAIDKIVSEMNKTLPREL